jgi:hypothetical protein
MNNNFLIGIFTTLGWLVLMTVIFFSKTSLGDVAFNEIGDFLSGIFSPIAFLWLILGYIQQGQELKQNTAAITQQKDEYIKSIKLSSYVALMQYESKEMDLLNNLGGGYEKGAKKARERSKEYRQEIENLLNEIKSSPQIQR